VSKKSIGGKRGGIISARGKKNREHTGGGSKVHGVGRKKRIAKETRPKFERNPKRCGRNHVTMEIRFGRRGAPCPIERGDRGGLKNRRWRDIYSKIEKGYRLAMNLKKEGPWKTR